MKGGWLDRTRYGIHEFVYTLLTFPRAWRFMLNHRLWEGLRQYGWVARVLVIFGVISGIFVISEVVDWFDEHSSDPLYAMAIGSDSLLMRLVTDFYESLSDGGLNYLTLILLEVVIYHFMRRTLQIILRRSVENAHTFKPFLDAQVRMIIVMAVGFGMQFLLLDVFLDMFPLPRFVDNILAFVVEASILGYAIADNYNEQFELTVEQSIRHLWRRYLGICFGLGLPLLLLLKIPLFGTILGPLVTSVAAAIVLREKSDLHIVGYQMTDKEREKWEKKEAKRAAKAAKKAARRTRKNRKGKAKLSS